MKGRLAIIGRGYVGRAIELFFKDKFETVFYDPALGFIDKKAVNGCDLGVVCVPTNKSSNGGADLSAVEGTFAWLKTPLVVLKSTVPPGTTKRLAEQYNMQERLVFSPEYIGEGGYPVPHWQDIPHPTNMKLHNFFIFGGEKKALQKILPFFQRVGGPFARYLQTDSTTAELVKYMENTWIATKVTFCNEFYDIAKAFGVDYNELRELWLLDGRVGRSHTLVYPQKRGFDGKCIPKDTHALVEATKEVGASAVFLNVVLSINEKFQKLGVRK